MATASRIVYKDHGRLIHSTYHWGKQERGLKSQVAKDWQRAVSATFYTDWMTGFWYNHSYIRGRRVLKHDG